jgi:lipoprotein-anchoring transpeptidase ErfK/SrfK
MPSSYAAAGRCCLKLVAAGLAVGIVVTFGTTSGLARNAETTANPSRTMTRLGMPAPHARMHRRSDAKATRASRAASATPTATHHISSEKSHVTVPRAPRQAPAPLIAVVSLSSQRMRVYDGTGRIAETRVSTGMPGYRTPTGIYSVVQRNRHHRSNIYDGAPMPWMQRLTWSGIAIHAGIVPNRPASHGCIRVPYDFAPRLWSLGRIGMRVIIAQDDPSPTPIEHANLPTPALTPVAITEAPFARRTAAAGSDATAASDTVLLTPLDFAHVRRARAQASLLSAQADARGASEQARETSASATEASTHLRARWAAVEALEDRLSRLRAEIEAATDAARAALETEATDVEDTIATARARHTDAKAVEQAASDAAFAAVKALRAAEARLAETTAAFEASKPTTEPVTIFVSRAEGRISVRQAFETVHEEPIAIRDPDKPIGSHVFTALRDGNGGAVLHWEVATLAASRPGPMADEGSAGRTKHGARPQRPETTHRPSGPDDALARFDFPPAAREAISQRLWLGATLIVSDAPTSRETGKTTDIIVQP